MKKFKSKDVGKLIYYYNRSGFDGVVRHGVIISCGSNIYLDRYTRCKCFDFIHKKIDFVAWNQIDMITKKPVKYPNQKIDPEDYDIIG